MAKIRIIQIKSGIHHTVRQKRTLTALGLKKLHHTVEKESTPQILGMVDSIKHLVRVENI
ncbi:MAG: large subunit ribosomal protein L30 [Bacteroidetes bacterium]|nr:MAG: large subunit ribosomal protein L30 [Bacteroidota bacterium]